MERITTRCGGGGDVQRGTEDLKDSFGCREMASMLGAHGKVDVSFNRRVG